MQVKNWRRNKCIRIKEKEAIYQANLLEEMLIFLHTEFPANLAIASYRMVGIIVGGT